MQKSLQEYRDARLAWRNALKAETDARILVQQARDRFQRAKRELRAEEQEMLEMDLVVPVSLELTESQIRI